MALGAKLREARMRQGLTTSQVAASTRMKVQTVEAIEREEFRSIPAPIYVKGFIRLFAARVGIDPNPLIEEYIETLANGRPPAMQKRTEPPVEPPEAVPIDAGAQRKPEPTYVTPPDGEDDLFSLAQDRPASDDAPEPPAAREAALPAGGLVAAVRQGLSAVGRGGRALCERATDTVRETLPAARTTLARIRFGEAPLKTIAIAIGAALVLLFILSALSRHIRRPEADTAASGGDLYLAIDPPDPYME